LGKLAANQYPDLVRQMERPAILRTIRGIRPVIIPYERPSTQEQTETPIFIAPAPETNGYADPNNLTESTRSRIRQLAQELPSQAAVERAVFGYHGGAAYRAVTEVLDEPA
jgi:hypothetical protein